MFVDIDTLIGQGCTSETMHASFSIKNVLTEEQIVFGEVYAPYVIDSHKEMMLPDDVRKLAHRFLLTNKNQQIDIMHNNKLVKASLVESFIARKGDPDYTEGAWVLAVKIFDDKVWQMIKSGRLSGYSLEAMVYKYEATIEYDYLHWHFGITEENDGHYHAFFVEVDEDGRVIGGCTSEGDDGHTHPVKFGTATEISNEHAHRYFLNEIDDDED